MGAKERNKNYVLERQRSILERGITGVSMADIAKEADFGVASVYRYFGNRNALIMECAVSIWQDKRDKLRVVYEKICRKADMTRSSCLRNIFRGLS